MGTEEKKKDPLTREIIGAAIEVHRGLGPGLLESAYAACLSYELSRRRLRFEQEKPLPITYKDVKLDAGYRLDFLVENEVVVEVKAVDALVPLHEAQILSYLKLGGYKRGLLINFNVKVLKDGIKRIVLDF